MRYDNSVDHIVMECVLACGGCGMCKMFRNCEYQRSNDDSIAAVMNIWAAGFLVFR